MRDAPLAAYRPFSVSHGDITHDIYETGDGQPVLVMHELPGLTPAALRFGRRLADRGFHVYLPLLFGEAGQSAATESYRRLCVSREFARLIRRDLPAGSAWRTLTTPPHATLTEEYERAPDRPSDPTRILFEEVVTFLRAHAGRQPEGERSLQ